MRRLDQTTSSALLFGGDWALAHGDVEALAYVARALADRLHGQLGQNLRAFAKLCVSDCDRAVLAWQELHDAVSTSLCAERGATSRAARRELR